MTNIGCYGWLPLCENDSKYWARRQLHQLSHERPELLDAIAEQQAKAIRAEIATLEQQAHQLGEEIESLTGMPAPYAD